MAAQERLERLLNLTAALLCATRPLTASEIAERVPGYGDTETSKGAFRRSFERDKEALREMGVPLVLSVVPGTDPPVEGYRIPPERYQLRDPGLEAEELAALHLATVAVRMEGLRGTGAMWKLGGVPDVNNEAPIAHLAATPMLGVLFEAVGQRSPVKFFYRGEQRHLDPYRLSYARGHWYLEGWDHDRSAERQFRLDRLEGDIDVGEIEQFERQTPHSSPKSQPWEMGEEPAISARVLIDADQAGWAVDQLGADSVSRRFDDGSVEVTITVTNREGFRSFMLGFLEHGEVLSPVELRDDLIAWLESIAVGGP